jgi:hypothetical protein
MLQKKQVAIELFLGELERSLPYTSKCLPGLEDKLFLGVAIAMRTTGYVAYSIYGLGQQPNAAKGFVSREPVPGLKDSCF